MFSQFHFCWFVRLSLCYLFVSVCQQDYLKTCRQIFTKLIGGYVHESQLNSTRVYFRHHAHRKKHTLYTLRKEGKHIKHYTKLRN